MIYAYVIGICVMSFLHYRHLCLMNKIFEQQRQDNQAYAEQIHRQIKRAFDDAKKLS